MEFFHRNCFEKKFAMKCYEAVLYTLMNCYLFENKLIYNWIQKYCWYKKCFGLLTNWPRILWMGFVSKISWLEMYVGTPFISIKVTREVSRLLGADCFLSSANEVWEGYRNAGRPSVCMSFRPNCERDVLRTVSPIEFENKNKANLC